MINWENNQTEILLNPRYSPEEYSRFYRFLESISSFKGHMWLATSGTSGQTKFVALSKEAILISAASVNNHLESDSNDIWLNPLPLFHVGGLGITARGHLSGAHVYHCQEKWNPDSYCKSLNEHKVTLSSLVPTQLYDLVKLQMTPPASLRSVIVGGGAIETTLYDQAQKLSWPILTSYGLTECSSQVATSTPDTSKLKILSHVNVKIIDGLIHIQSKSLLTAYAYLDEGLIDPKNNGWLKTEDRGEIINGFLTVFGRSSDFIKIGGESVDLSELRSILYQVKDKLKLTQDIILATAPDPRLGKVIHLIAEKTIPQSLIEAYNAAVLPFAKIRSIQIVPEIKRTPTGKIYLNNP